MTSIFMDIRTRSNMPLTNCLVDDILTKVWCNSLTRLCFKWSTFGRVTDESVASKETLYVTYLNHNIYTGTALKFWSVFCLSARKQYDLAKSYAISTATFMLQTLTNTSLFARKTVSVSNEEFTCWEMTFSGPIFKTFISQKLRCIFRWLASFVSNK